MKLRPYQEKLIQTLENQINTEKLEDVLLNVATGGGKTLSGLMAFHVLKTFGFVDKLLWVGPRLSLSRQVAEKAAEGFTTELGHVSYQLNEATNDFNPCRGLDGYATTYSAIGCDASGINAYEVETGGYMVVLDEVHHIAANSPWERNLAPVLEHAVFRLFMSGTLGRSDEKQIAFLPYIAQEKNHA